MKYFREVRAEVERLVRRLIAVIQVRDGWVAWTRLVEVEVVRSDSILISFRVGHTEIGNRKLWSIT